MTAWESATEKWRSVKPIGIALAVGLVAGPFISNAFGWQVTSSVSRTMVHDGVVEQQAVVCDKAARGEVAEPAKLGWDAQRELAKKWAAAGGAKPDDWDVVNACSRKLGV